jgi:hypothetical protein
MKVVLQQRIFVLQNLALKYLQIVGADLNSVRFYTEAHCE